MNSDNNSTTQTKPAQPPPLSPAGQTKRPFVQPMLTKQGKVTLLTNDFIGGGSGIEPTNVP